MATGQRRKSGPEIPGLYRIRLERGLTVVDLAERSGVNRQTIARIESGKPASVPTVAKLARALGLSVDELIKATPGQEMTHNDRR